MPIRHSSLLTHNSPEDVLTFGTVEKKSSFAFLLLTRLDRVRILESLTFGAPLELRFTIPMGKIFG